MSVYIPTIDTCDSGHRFAKLADHPVKNGIARCPHCLAQGVDRRTAWIDAVLDKCEKDQDFLKKVKEATHGML